MIPWGQCAFFDVIALTSLFYFEFAATIGAAANDVRLIVSSPNTHPIGLTFSKSSKTRKSMLEAMMCKMWEKTDVYDEYRLGIYEC